MSNLSILHVAKVILLQLLFYLLYDVSAIGCNKMTFVKRWRNNNIYYSTEISQYIYRKTD